MKCRLAVLMAEKDPTLSQRRLSLETGVDKEVISQLRKNTFQGVQSKTINALCTYFDCEVGELFVMKEVEADE